MGRSFSWAVPLAAGAAVLTLVCSYSLLNSSPAALNVRHTISEGESFRPDGAPHLNEYMTSAANFAGIGAAADASHHEGHSTAQDPPKPVQGADASPPSVAPPLLAIPEAEYDGHFLYARPDASMSAAPDQAPYLRSLLKSMLGMGVLLKRTVVLPAALCNCKDAELTQCDGPPVAPFDCPLRIPLDAEAWRLTTLVPIKPARFLLHKDKLPDIVRCNHLRVLLPDGMDDSELGFALRSYKDTRWLEIETAHKTFCGWDTRMPGNPKRMVDFTTAADALLGVPTPMHVCTHYRGGTGEVLQFTNLGCNTKHVVTTEKDKLPANLRNLPEGTDIMVTFATGSVATMACNWVATVRKAGVNEVVIGALDQEMMDACEKANVPCVKIEGGAVSKALSQRSAANVRSDPALYPKMSVLKVGFYRELLSFGYNVWACDADAVFMNDPRSMMRQKPWDLADVAIATDCIDVPGDTRYPLLHCDFNTGLVFMRARPAVVEFTERWRETIATAKEARIRDQAAFNMMTKLKRPEPLRDASGAVVPRLFTATNGGDGHIKLGVLPLNRYLNGHTFFVQHVHTLPQAEPPLSVHMTYQFAEGSKFAHGKRQRLRQAGLWLVDDDSYFNGHHPSAPNGYITVVPEHATLPVVSMGPNVDSRDAVRQHLAEAKHRTAMLRPLLGMAKALGRALILPRMLCYCDFMWKEMKNCRVGGAETMRLPFDCPMDHVLDTPKWFENSLGVEVREPAFLQNPRVPANVSGSIARVELPKGKVFDDKSITEFLKPHSHARIIELEEVRGSFCGFPGDAAFDATFRSETERLLHYQRTPFCMMEGSDNAPLFSQCCHPRKPGDKYFPCVHGFDGPDDLPRCEGGGGALFG